MQIGVEINFACHVFILKFRDAAFAVFLYHKVKVVFQFLRVHLFIRYQVVAGHLIELIRMIIKKCPG